MYQPQTKQLGQCNSTFITFNYCVNFCLMKKIILFIFFSCFFNLSIAQIQNGSIAPDFTVVDLNGKTHNLSDYLNNGKTVILKFSSVISSADWIYDQQQALQ